MPTWPAIHSTDNLRIGKGVLYFKEEGGSTYADLGECPSLVYTPNITKKDHFTARLGIRTKDVTRITEIAATVKFTLEGVTADTLALFFLSTVTSGSGSSLVVKGLSKTTFKGAIKLVGTNDVGRRLNFDADVSFVPAGDFSFITDTDDYTQIQIEADVLADVDGNYGIVTDEGVA